MRIACAPNFRDFGNRPTRDGGFVRSGRLFRSEAISTPNDEDREALAALGVRLVCDLRSARERADAVSHWLGTGADVLAMDVVADFRATDDPLAAMREDPGEAGALAMMISTYRALPGACASHLAMLFDRLAAGDHPVLIHCTAGKDRTGFFSAMLLAALGVSEADIMADYLMSGQCPNKDVIAATRAIMQTALGREVDEAALDLLTGVRPELLGASFDQINEDHGSVQAYLERAAGLDERRRTRILDALVEQAGA